MWACLSSDLVRLGEARYRKSNKSNASLGNCFQSAWQSSYMVRHTCQCRLIYTRNDIIPELVVHEEPQDDKGARVTHFPRPHICAVETGMIPLFYLQPVVVVCAIMSLLAVTDAISVCGVRLTIERWNSLVNLLEAFSFRCLACARFGSMLRLVDGT